MTAGRAYKGKFVGTMQYRGQTSPNVYDHIKLEHQERAICPLSARARARARAVAAKSGEMGRESP